MSMSQVLRQCPPPGNAGLQPGSRSHAGAWRSQGHLWRTGSGCMKQTSKYLTKNNFILFSEILEHVFHVVNQMRPAFIGIQLYPFVFYKAPQYLYTIQFRRIFW